MEAEHRKLERLESKIASLRKELEKLKCVREDRERHRRVNLEILQDQKQDVEEKIQRAQDALTQTNHGMRPEYKDAIIQSTPEVGTTIYVLRVESQLCRSLHGMYVLNRLYAARQTQMEQIKTALKKVIKMKKEEGGVIEFQTVRQLYQKQLEMQEFSDWIEEQCLEQCEILSSLKERVEQLLESHHHHHHQNQQHLPAPTWQSCLPAIDEANANDRPDDDDDEEDCKRNDDDDDDKSVEEEIANMVEPYNSSSSSKIGNKIGKSTIISQHPAAANNASLLSFLMLQTKMDYEQQQRWMASQNDSESFCTLFIGDLEDGGYQATSTATSIISKEEQPVPNNTSDSIPTACQPVAQSA